MRYTHTHTHKHTHTHTHTQTQVGEHEGKMNQVASAAQFLPAHQLALEAGEMEAGSRRAVVEIGGRGGGGGGVSRSGGEEVLAAAGHAHTQIEALVKELQALEKKIEEKEKEKEKERERERGRESERDKKIELLEKTIEERERERDKKIEKKFRDSSLSTCAEVLKIKSGVSISVSKGRVFFQFTCIYTHT